MSQAERESRALHALKKHSRADVALPTRFEASLVCDQRRPLCIVITESNNTTPAWIQFQHATVLLTHILCPAYIRTTYAPRLPRTLPTATHPHAETGEAGCLLY